MNLTEWSAAFWQYVPVATAYKHFDLGDAMAEKARVKGELEIKAVVYDSEVCGPAGPESKLGHC